MTQIDFYTRDGVFVKSWPNWTGVVPAKEDVVALHWGDNNEEDQYYIVCLRLIDGTRPDYIKIYIKELFK